MSAKSESEFDVIVVGCGVWGSATMWALAKRGYSVLGLDKFAPPHNHGSHGGATRLARMSNSTGSQYTRLTRPTLDLWQKLGDETGQQIFVETGTMFIGEKGSRWFDSTLANLVESDFEYEVLPPAQAMERVPGLKVSASESVVWEPAGGIILVEPAITSLHKVIRGMGVTLEFDQEVTEWSSDGESISVTTDKGSYSATNLVITAGSFTNTLLDFELPMSIERQVLFNFPVKAGAAPLPALYFSAPPGVDSAPAYGCPEPDGSYKVSVASSGNPLEPEKMTQDANEDDLKLVRDVVGKRLPMLEDSAVASNVCMWSEVIDGHWIIGKHPEHARVVIGTGCNGRGFRFGAIAGELLSDLVEDRLDDPALKFFSLERFNK